MSDIGLVANLQVLRVDPKVGKDLGLGLIPKSTSGGFKEGWWNVNDFMRRQPLCGDDWLKALVGASQPAREIRKHSFFVDLGICNRKSYSVRRLSSETCFRRAFGFLNLPAGLDYFATWVFQHKSEDHLKLPRESNQQLTGAISFRPKSERLELDNRVKLKRFLRPERTIIRDPCVDCSRASIAKVLCILRNIDASQLKQSVWNFGSIVQYIVHNR
ncbi:conserved hypothetical protein [Histoplasma capsulatum var. duboisii H88]|uniref:Uncharacterized protein n=1 Tax=Ajellomyces capsulatus (strain H88) TaxID=544711 RepID=F0UC98_AJEC8|nr:conserved hypothetical protein [Histoplasma capsulatum var. duboisii H88]